MAIRDRLPWRRRGHHGNGTDNTARPRPMFLGAGLAVAASIMPLFMLMDRISVTHRGGDGLQNFFAFIVTYLICVALGLTFTFIGLKRRERWRWLALATGLLLLYPAAVTMF